LRRGAAHFIQLPVSIGVVGGSQSDRGAGNPTWLPPARIHAATAAMLIATIPSRTAIIQRGILRRARLRRGGRQRWVCGRERNGRRWSWATSDTHEHLREECPQPDDGAFRRCAEGLSVCSSRQEHRAASTEAFRRCARTSLDVVVADQGGPSYPHGWDDNHPATSGQPNRPEAQ
jgi:hypothetical protein